MGLSEFVVRAGNSTTSLAGVCAIGQNKGRFFFGVVVWVACVSVAVGVRRWGACVQWGK